MRGFIVLNSFLGLFVVLLVAAIAFGQEKIKFPVGVGTKTFGTNAIFLATKKDSSTIWAWRSSRYCCAAHRLRFRHWWANPSTSRWARRTRRSAPPATGVDLFSVGGVVNGLTQVIVAGKKYKTYSDLRGTTIGVQALTSGATNVLKRILKKNGLDYPADYKLLAVGGGSFNLAALTSGQISATYLVVPLNYSAEEQGFNVLGYYKDYFPNYQLSVLAVKRAWAEKNRALLVRFSRAPSGPSLALCEQRGGHRFSRQGDSTQAGACAQGLGILHGEPDLASQCRDKPRRAQVHHGDLCRTGEEVRRRIR